MSSLYSWRPLRTDIFEAVVTYLHFIASSSFACDEIERNSDGPEILDLLRDCNHRTCMSWAKVEQKALKETLRYVNLIEMPEKKITRILRMYRLVMRQRPKNLRNFENRKEKVSSAIQLAGRSKCVGRLTSILYSLQLLDFSVVWLYQKHIFQNDKKSMNTGTSELLWYTAGFLQETHWMLTENSTRLSLPNGHLRMEM